MRQLASFMAEGRITSVTYRIGDTYQVHQFEPVNASVEYTYEPAISDIDPDGGIRRQVKHRILNMLGKDLEIAIMQAIVSQDSVKDKTRPKKKSGA
tara:strand:+ start:2268 stop:2555 length:288 start_codon:yes stop_codon:yes gene_type:complete